MRSNGVAGGRALHLRPSKLCAVAIEDRKASRISKGVSELRN
jgi:hypothetical protein